jgi:hypothetical protein
MRLKLPLLALLVCVSVNLGTANAVNSQQGVFSFNGQPGLTGSLLPKFNSSLDNLDPRDTDNGAVNTVEARKELEDLFSSGLYSLLCLKKIYTTNELAGLLSNALNLGRSFLTRDVPRSFGRLVFAILPSEKRRNSSALCSLPGFLIFPSIILFGLTAFLTQDIPTSDKALLVLRC